MSGLGSNVVIHGNCCTCMRIAYRIIDICCSSSDAVELVTPDVELLGG